MSNLGYRQFKEKLFQGCGLIAITISCLFLCILLTTIIVKSYGAFITTKLQLDINIPSAINIEDSYASQMLITNSLRQLNPTHFKQLEAYISLIARDELQNYIKTHPASYGQTIKVWLTASDAMRHTLKNLAKLPYNNPTASFIQRLKATNSIKSSFSLNFLTGKESREPELAGILSGAVGSLYLILICMVTAFPLGVLTAIYLEEFAPKNKLTYFIEININNLAAVPSIIFGLLGLAIYIGMWHLPRSSPLVGGMTLALMILPTIVVTTRNAIKLIPNHLKEGVMALGASQMQILLSFTLPLALPGIITGAILSIARAIGETAPLMIIGMVAFIVDPPTKVTDPATAMPIQIYLWSDSPEAGFIEKTSAAILMLLLVLVVINILTIFIRKKFQHKW
jgi:phosphate transport system permease protein